MQPGIGPYRKFLCSTRLRAHSCKVALCLKEDTQRIAQDRVVRLLHSLQGISPPSSSGKACRPGRRIVITVITCSVRLAPSRVLWASSPHPCRHLVRNTHPLPSRQDIEALSQALPLQVDPGHSSRSEASQCEASTVRRRSCSKQKQHKHQMAGVQEGAEPSTATACGAYTFIAV